MSVTNGTFAICGEFLNIPFKHFSKYINQPIKKNLLSGA